MPVICLHQKTTTSPRTSHWKVAMVPYSWQWGLGFRRNLLWAPEYQKEKHINCYYYRPKSKTHLISSKKMIGNIPSLDSVIRRPLINTATTNTPEAFIISLLVRSISVFQLLPHIYRVSCVSFGKQITSPDVVDDTKISRPTMMSPPQCTAEITQACLVWTSDPSGHARKGLRNNLARKCLAGMPQFLNPANFIFQARLFPRPFLARPEGSGVQTRPASFYIIQQPWDYWIHAACCIGGCGSKENRIWDQATPFTEIPPPSLVWRRSLGLHNFGIWGLVAWKQVLEWLPSSSHCCSWRSLRRQP